MRRLKPHLPTLFLLLSLAIVAIFRYMVVRQHMDMGQDIANYLTTMNTFLGQTEDNALARTRPIVRFMENRVATSNAALQ
jgi:predicted PurR-regulated permease PerM